jgi:phytanoyl-CoA hydroxylase
VYSTTDPAGFEVSIPESYEDDNKYFTREQLGAAEQYYREHGYTVLRGSATAVDCETARRSFDDGIRPYPGFLSRQTGSNAQRNKFNDRGFLMNPILNVQDVPERLGKNFRRDTLKVICNDLVRDFLRLHFGEDPAIVQTMYFEGNSETWPHQDTYYLDSEKIGTMVAAWYALEDIKPGAGRFFVYEKSHLIDLRKNGGDFDIAFNHSRYKNLVVDLIREQKLACKAPALRQGDVLLWNSKTIHGSLRTSQLQYSRSSLTAHFIPLSHRFLQFQSLDKRLNYRNFDGWKIHHPKPLDEFKPRVMLGLESNFPRGFALLKKVAIKSFLGN